MFTAQLIPLLLIPASVGQGDVDGSETVVRRASVMGTWITIELDAPDRQRGLAATELAFEAVRRAETRLSTWGNESELARLNQSPVGETFTLSDELRDELHRVVELWHETNGCFDPGVGALVEAWGLRSGGREPSESTIVAALAPNGLESLALDGKNARRRHPALEIEEGGFGKGSALDAALDVLRGAGVDRAVIDLGGQISVMGTTPHRIPLAHPTRRDVAAVEVAIEGGSLATSGNSERGIEVDGHRLSHILDPRSGRPAPDVGSVSVWATDGLSADALSTGLFVMGPEGALAWAAERDGVEVVVMEASPDSAAGLRVRATPGLRGRLTPSLDDVRIEFTGSRPDAAPLSPTGGTYSSDQVHPRESRGLLATQRQ